MSIRGILRQVSNFSQTVGLVANATTRSALDLFHKHHYQPPESNTTVVRVQVDTDPQGNPVEVDVQVGQPDAAVANGRTVLMLHGFPEFWGVWAPQIPALLAAGFRVLIPDQRGYNKSSKPRTDDGGSNYGVPTLANDALAVLDHFAPPAEKIFLVGHDFGGAVSWWLAMVKPERFERLLIASMPHLKAFFNAWEHDREQTWDSRYIGGFLTQSYAPVVTRLSHARIFSALLVMNARRGTFNHKNLEPFEEAWNRARRQRPDAVAAMLNWYDALWATFQIWRDAPQDFKWPGGTGEVTIPTYYCDGEDDAFFVEDLIRPTLRLCTHPDSRGVLVPHLNHWFFWDEPGWFNETILIPWLTTGAVVADPTSGLRTVDPWMAVADVLAASGLGATP